MSTGFRINLLDWRAEAREAKRRQFIAMIGVVAAATIVLFGVLPVLYYDHRISNQDSRNDYLSDQIAAADQKLVEIKKLKKIRESLVDRMQVIAQLQRSRSSIVHYFDQLVATIPDGVYLTGLTQDGDTTTLNGIAESNARVSQYMINLDNSPWFTNPRLIVITRDDSGSEPRADFTLKVDSTNPEAPATNADNSATGSSAKQGTAS